MGGGSGRRALAPIYGRVLDLRDEGASDEAIAAAVGVELTAVAALVDVATRKEANCEAAVGMDEEA